MRIRFFGVMCLLLSGATAASAQYPRPYPFEVQPFVGYTFGGSVNLAPNAQNIVKANFESSPVYGVSVLYNGRPNWGLEFLWHRQPTKVFGEINETTTFPTKIDLNLDQYHGNLIITLADEQVRLKPFLLVGMGATRAGGAGDSITKFSMGVGGGVRYFFSEHMGMRMQGRWSPTYIKSTTAGFYCSYWGFCWEINDAHFLHQYDATVGLIVRF